MPKHYIVGENTPGYTGENDPEYFTSKAAAQAYAKSLADQYREMNWDRERVDGKLAYAISGSKKTGYYIVDRDQTYPLGRVIWIMECEGRIEDCPDHGDLEDEARLYA